MKKTLKAQLLASIAMMLVAIVALSGATYAWFTASANPQVSLINLGVKGADGLFLSADPNAVYTDITDWRTSIDRTNINDRQGGSGAVIPAESIFALTNVSGVFYEASTAYGNFFKATTFLPDGTPTAYVAANPIVGATGDYVKFSLWAKLTSGKGLFALDVADADAASWVKNVTTGVPGGIKHTIRIGFVPTAADGTSPEFNNAVIWEPNHNDHVAAIDGGKYSAAGFQATSALTAVGGTTATQTTQYNPSNKAWAGYTALGTAKLGLFALDATDLAGAPENAAKRFDVYVWVEGADGDTVNSVANSVFSTLLQFTLVAPN